MRDKSFPLKTAKSSTYSESRKEALNWFVALMSLKDVKTKVRMEKKNKTKMFVTFVLTTA